MNPPDLLRLRAHRMLGDGHKHSEAAILWAMELAGHDAPLGEVTAHDARMRGFTEDELRLGGIDVNRT